VPAAWLLLALEQDVVGADAAAVDDEVLIAERHLVSHDFG
jgi:hypothetical protein